MQSHHCLNCNASVHNKFCPNCGQKSDTHRITIKHFVMHDLLHGVWHLERGILFTMKEAFVRPGQAALDYIGGKRIRYYNVFYLSLLLIGLNILLSHYYESIHPTKVKKMSESGLRVIDFFAVNLKFILLSLIPILALNGKIIFRRLKLNLAEHLILNGITLLGILMTSLFFMFIRFLLRISPDMMETVLGLLKTGSLAIMCFYPLWTYYNASRKRYTFLGITWRLLAFYLLVLVQLFIILAIMVVTLNEQLLIPLNI